jgi:hypothetical protein
MLCMPPYFSYLLQPLDAGCFSQLKPAYSREIKALNRYYINYITMLKFLLAFKAVSERLITAANIYSAFKR